MDRCGLVWIHTDSHRLVGIRINWCGSVRIGVDWWGFVLIRTDLYGLGLIRKILYGLVWIRMDWYGFVRIGTDSPKWYGKWYGNLSITPQPGPRSSYSWFSTTENLFKFCHAATRINLESSCFFDSDLHLINPAEFRFKFIRFLGT